MRHTATLDDIRAGKLTDVYFQHALEALRGEGVDKQVVAEIAASGLPDDAEWAVLAGLEEALVALEGVPVEVHAMPEGTLFCAGEPVMRIRGMYTEFGVLETALLGFLCQASGIATKAARCKRAAEGRRVISFGARRAHPAIAPMVERAAYIAGCDGVAVVKSAELLGIEPTGTMPHALVLILGDLRTALLAFDRHVDPSIPRVALVDTFQDERFASLIAAETLGEKLAAVRLDTPGSRRGNLLKILEEVRWELDLRGHGHVRLFVSGGIDEHDMAELNALCDGYGVGTAISGAPVVNFALDLVEIEGTPITKRGKRSGVKDVLVCDRCGARQLVPASAQAATCPKGHPWAGLLQPMLRDGALLGPLPSPNDIRAYVLGQVERLP